MAPMLWVLVVVMDWTVINAYTPGFTSVSLEGLEKESFREYYPEFTKPGKKCRFALCSHISEPGCAVKKALDDNTVSRLRYDNYVKIYNELANKRRY